MLGVQSERTADLSHRPDRLWSVFAPGSNVSAVEPTKRQRLSQLRAPSLCVWTVLLENLRCPETFHVFINYDDQ